MRTTVKAAIFDLDDTLFDCTGCLVEGARRRAAEALVEGGLPMSVEEALALQQELSEVHDPHFLVFDEIARRHQLSDDTVDAAIKAYNSEEVGDIAVFPDVVPTLQILRRQGILCLLLTAGHHRRQEAKITRLGLADQFDETVVNDLDRGALMSECVRYFLRKYNLHPAEVLIVGDRLAAEIRVGNELGMATAQMRHGRFSLATPRDQLEVPDYRIRRIFQVPTILRLADMGKVPDNLRIVAIGGGTGLPIVLEGCKPYCRNLTAIVAVTDSGRSSGKLRDELGMLAPGDVRNCLVALTEPGEMARHLNALFQYRFSNGSLEGMSLGNLIIAAMTGMSGSFEEGIKALSGLLQIRGKVLPATVTNCHVCAELEDGTTVEREVNVRGLNKPPIRRVFLKPQDPQALDEAIEEVLRADIIVLGPGSLYTSIIPNILVPALLEAFLSSRAQKFYVCNIVTQRGQTDGFSASDHYGALVRHLGADSLDCMLVNSGRPDQETVERYGRQGAELVMPCRGGEELRVRTAESDLVEDVDPKRLLWEKQDLLRHDPDKLGDAICRLYGNIELRWE